MKSANPEIVDQSPPSESEDQPRGKGWWRPVLLIALVVAVLVSTQFFDLEKQASNLREWIDSLGAWGPIVFVLIYVVAAVAAIPGSALTLIAGALFGSILGVIVVSISATLGAALSFLIARYFARDAAARWLSKKERFRKLDRMTEENGAVMVALTRLVPIFPFNLLNYGFGLTRVPFWTYVLWSWLCMLPATILYVVFGDAATEALTEGQVPWLLIGVVALFAVILFFLVRFAKSKLRASEEESNLQ